MLKAATYKQYFALKNCDFAKLYSPVLWRKKAFTYKMSVKHKTILHYHEQIFAFYDEAHLRLYYFQLRDTNVCNCSIDTLLRNNYRNCQKSLTSNNSKLS